LDSTFSMPGWSLIYKSEGKYLVTTGIYRHIRHPQYVGLFVITVGFLIQWPTLITLILWPFLLLAYYRLAKREEAEVAKQFPQEFPAYKAAVPGFSPEFLKERAYNHHEKSRTVDDYRLRLAVTAHFYSPGFRGQWSGIIRNFHRLNVCVPLYDAGHHHGGDDQDEKHRH
jgi:hypothetical protein